ncbi:MAG: LamG-like jellyroll fold domain-containing protein [Saprospiraceae bacterium]
MATLPLEFHSIHSQHGDHYHHALGYSFNGNSDGIVLPSTWGGSSELTVEAWFKSSGSTGDFQAILSSDNESFIHFQVFNAGNIACFTNKGTVVLPVIPEIDNAKWRHAAAIIKSGASKLIIDGVQIGDTNTLKFDYILPSDHVCIGMGYHKGRFFKGEIGDVKIWQQAREHQHVHGDIFQYFEQDRKPKLIVPVPEHKIFGFKSIHGKYMSAQPNGTMECNRDWLRGWEKFTLDKTTDGKYGLKSYHGKYLSAQPDGRLECNRDWLRSWEKFELEKTADGKYGLKGIHGKYVSAQPNGSIVCDHTWLRGWEKFSMDKA